MPPRMVSASEHIKASLSAGVYTNKHGGTHVYLVRVCFLFGQIQIVTPLRYQRDDCCLHVNIQSKQATLQALYGLFCADGQRAAQAWSRPSTGGQRA